MAAKDVQVLLKEEIGDIPEAMGFSGCQATGEDWSNTDRSDIDEFLSYTPAIRFTAPQKYAEYSTKLNGFFITVQQQMKRPEDAKEDIPSNVSLLKVQVIQHDTDSCKTIGFSNYVAITEKEAEIIKSIEQEKGRPLRHLGAKPFTSENLRELFRGNYLSLPKRWKIGRKEQKCFWAAPQWRG